MIRFLKPIVFALPAVLVACGGGGGSSGTTTEQYSIALRADKNVLPVNLASEAVGQGVYAPYTTTLYVSAKRGNELIPGGEDIFSCNMSAGLDSAVLYYLDGDDKHEDDNGNPLAYRSIVLPSNSGGSSFHLHAKNQAGKATVVCSVTDPRDGKQYAASVDVTIGGGSTNTPASVVTRFPPPPQTLPTTPGYDYLGTVGNTDNMPSAGVLQTEVWNDNNQPVSASGKANVQVSILPTGYANDASAGARLMAGGKTAQSLLLSSNAGIAQYSIASGSKKGVIFVRAVTDRADNDVTNGIQEPIEHLFVVSVTDVRPSATALAVDTAQFNNVTIQNGQPFAFPLAATGGTLPYTWTLASALPSGLSLSSSGILQGTVRVDTPGTRNVVLVVTDARGASVTVGMPLVIEGTLPLDPVNLVINGCSGSTTCQLPGGVVGSAYSHVLSASGGSPMTWVFSGLPSWLKGDGQDAAGILTSGALLTCDDVGVHPFAVTVKNSTNSVTREVSITVPAPADNSCATPPAGTNP